jgi:hypothetical protein
MTGVGSQKCGPIFVFENVAFLVSVIGEDANDPFKIGFESC